MKRVSIIIPCFNHGKYLEETVQSALDQTWPETELIVVNDGSTDPFTLQVLEKISKKNITVIHTPNQGLPSARNTGIAASTGEYILPLDSDDRIAPTYVEKAVEILERNPETGIVYCLAEFFDGKSGSWNLPDFSIERILQENLIFCSALFRKSDYLLAGGYKPSMKYGSEDWDIWLSILELNRKVYRIPEVLFYYRWHNYSMVRSITEDQTAYTFQQIYQNHIAFYGDKFENPIHLFHRLNEANRLLSAAKEENERYKRSFICRIFRKVDRIFSRSK